MNSFSFTVPRCKSKKNNMIAARGRVFKSKAVSQEEDMIALIARSAANAAGWIEPASGVTLLIDWAQNGDQVTISCQENNKPLTKRRFDLQNLTEVICDALEAAGIVKNDKQFNQILLSETVS